jgi:hypothetical protein
VNEASKDPVTFPKSFSDGLLAVQSLKLVTESDRIDISLIFDFMKWFFCL